MARESSRSVATVQSPEDPDRCAVQEGHPPDEEDRHTGRSLDVRERAGSLRQLRKGVWEHGFDSLVAELTVERRVVCLWGMSMFH